MQLIFVCAVIIGLGIAFFALPDRVLSEKENRTLTAAPAASVSGVLSGEYTAALGDYYADQFPGRDSFVAAKAYFELFLGKGENNGVIYAASDTLVARPQNTAPERSLDSIAAFSEAIGVQVCLAAIPRSADVFSERLPALYPRASDAALWERFADGAAQRGLSAPDLYTPLCESGAYYRTDHHYTTRGAYLAYTALADSLGYEPYGEDFFRKETVTRDFEGTSMRSSGFYLARCDEIELWRYDGDEAYSVSADGEMIALYDFSALKKTDKYAVFLGGNHGRVDIRASQERSKLLIIRDSFADSVAPFLALHYDLILIDLRYFHGSVQELAATEDISRVLVLASITELADAKRFSYLEIPYLQE